MGESAIVLVFFAFCQTGVPMDSAPSTQVSKYPSKPKLFAVVSPQQSRQIRRWCCSKAIVPRFRDMKDSKDIIENRRQMPAEDPRGKGRTISIDPMGDGVVLSAFSSDEASSMSCPLES